MACGCFVTAVGAADRSESLMNEILGRDDELYKKRYFSSYSNFKGYKSYNGWSNSETFVSLETFVTI